MSKKFIYILLKAFFLWGIIYSVIYLSLAHNIEVSYSVLNFESKDIVSEEEKESEKKSDLKKGFELASGNVFLLESSVLYLDDNCSKAGYKLPTKTSLEKVGQKGEIFQVSYDGKSFFIPSSRCTDTLMDFDWSFGLEGTVSNESILTVDTSLQKLPLFIKDSFVNDGWTFLIDSANINEKYHEGRAAYEIAGLTSYMNKQIYFGNYGERLKKAVIHEFGHYYDYRLIPGEGNKFSESQEFQKIFAEESSNLIFIDEVLSQHAQERASEFFAESFQQYFLNPELLQEHCPQTYDMFDHLITEEILTMA